MRPKEIKNNITDIYENLFSFAATPAAIFRISGNSILTNRSFRIQLGYSVDPADDLTIKFLDIFEDQENGEIILRKLRSRGVIRRQETRLNALKRRGFSVLISGRLFSHLGEDYFQISFTDISRQKDLQHTIRRKNARMISIMENLSVGLFFVNNSGALTNLNQKLGMILKIDEDNLLQHPYQDLFAIIINCVEEPEILQQQLSDAMINLAQHAKVGFSLKNVVPFHYELALFPVYGKDGFSMGWGGVVQDITEMKQQTDWKLELLSILSHDIRSPLATLKGHVSVLRDNYALWGDEMISKFMGIIDQSVDKLSHQVDRNLALTRVEGSELGLRPQNINAIQVLHQAIENSIDTQNDVHIDLVIPDSLPNIRADASRVEEVFINLLDNAIRYSPADKVIQISIAINDPWLIFSVRDQGKGIPLAQQFNIFDKYVREEEGGMGLGLYISRKIVEAHGGKIAVKSPPEGMDRGTEFQFTLPIAHSTAQNLVHKENPHQQKPEKVKNQRILVVEDESDFQVLMRSMLIEEGYQVEIVADGINAMDILKDSPPDLVLLDWMLPGMNGLAICRNIRRWSNVPIIVVTSCTIQEELITALDAGADDYILKPFDRNELFARIRAIQRRGEDWKENRKMNRFSENGLLIDYETQETWHNGEKIHLSRTEYDILAYLSKHRRQVITYEQLIETVDAFWGESSRDVLFVHISRLRKKIEPNPKKPTFLVTRWGLGYIFMPN